MKRLLMLASFVGGLLFASLWMQQPEALAQTGVALMPSTAKPSVEKPTAPESSTKQDSQKQQTGRPQTGGPQTEGQQSQDLPPVPAHGNNTVKSVPNQPLLEPKPLPGNGALKQQQAIQDIMQLRQRFGSVISDGDGVFSQQIQHLVEDEPKPSESKPNHNTPNHSAPNHGQVQSHSQPTHRLQMPHSQEHVPDAEYQRFMLNNPIPKAPPTYTQPGQNIQYNLPNSVNHRPGFYQPGDSMNSQPERTRRLRQIARQLEESANQLEEMELYEKADHLRAQAHELRLGCRHPNPSQPSQTLFSTPAHPVVR